MCVDPACLAEFVSIAQKLKEFAKRIVQINSKWVQKKQNRNMYKKVSDISSDLLKTTIYISVKIVQKCWYINIKNII